MTPYEAKVPAAAARTVLLVLATDPAVRRFFEGELARDHDVLITGDEAEAARLLAEREVSLLVIDDADGSGPGVFGVRERLAAVRPVPAVMMAMPGEEDRIVEALRRGFVDYVVKRADTLQGDLFRARIESNLQIARLRRENEELHRAIEESQARLFNIYDSLDDVIMQVDHDCRVVSLNRSAAALANCEPKEAVGKVCWELFDFYPCERRARKEQCHIYRTFIEGETIRGEREDAETRSVHQYMTFITTLKDEDYTVYRETDITEKRRLEQKIAKALESLGHAPAPDDEPPK